MSFVPSGVQHELRAGDARAIAVEVGGGLREYVVAARPLLDGYAAGEMCAGGRGQLLIPWPNRVRDGRYQFGGATHQLALSEPAQRNAIHGLVRFAPWTLSERDASSVRLANTIHPSPGYPHRLAVSVEYRLSEQALGVNVEVQNRGEAVAPLGIGSHPYLRAGPGAVDQWVLTLPAGTHLLTDGRQIPVSRASVKNTPYDFRRPRRVGATELDAGYTDLERDGSGDCRIEVRADDGGGVALVVGENISHLMVFTGDTLSDIGRRRRGLAVEPMSCAPDAFNSLEGLQSLPPGATFRCRWRYEPIPPG
ncbi:MAG: aldose 1-epimerase family protein [Candidatus Dormibacteria bacterium]